MRAARSRSGGSDDRYQAVQKATLILEGLQGCLDHEKGGEIAPQLDRLYTHYIFRLQAINVDDDPAICDELIALIGELRESWAALAKPGASSPQPATAAAGLVTGIRHAHGLRSSFGIGGAARASGVTMRAAVGSEGRPPACRVLPAPSIDSAANSATLRACCI